MKRSDNLLRTNKLLDFAWPTAQPCEGEYLHKEHRSHHPLLFRFLHAVISAASADEVVSSALCGGIFGLATSFGLLAPNVLVRIAYDAYWRRRNEAKVRFLQ